MTERRAAVQPYLDKGMTHTEAYQRLLTAMPAIEARMQQRRNIETRKATRTVPTKSKPTAKAVMAFVEHDCEPSPLLRVQLRLAAMRTKPIRL